MNNRELFDMVRRSLNIATDGNRMFCDSNGWVLLALASERGRVRRIGNVFIEGGQVVYEKRITDAFYFKKWDGWGVNGIVVRAMSLVEGIVRLVNTDRRERLWLPAVDVEARGNWKWYKGKTDFERQVVVGDKEWVRERMR